MESTSKQSVKSSKPLAWLVEFNQFGDQDAWERVRHVVYEEPEGPYADLATPITNQVDLEAVLAKPSVSQFRRH